VLAGERCSNECADVAAADSEICYRNWSIATPRTHTKRYAAALPQITSTIKKKTDKKF